MPINSWERLIEKLERFTVSSGNKHKLIELIGSDRLI